MIKEVTGKNKGDIFQRLYKVGFGEYNTTHNPSDVFLQVDDKDGTILAMYAGYEHDKQTWYLQFACKFLENTDSPYWFGVELVNFIAQKYRYIMCSIENTNMPPLMRVLKSGFKIIGTRKPIHDNTLLVEFILDTQEIK